MKKLPLYLLLVLFSASVFTGCRDENDKDIEVENLKPDAEDSTDDETFETNPIQTEEDPYDGVDSTNAATSGPMDSTKMEKDSVKMEKDSVQKSEM